MALINFLKKIFRSKPQKQEIEKEQISFSEIENWIIKKKQENEIKEKEIINLIQKKISIFIRELKEKINIVENIDIDSKKADDKMKFFTNEGREKYLEATEYFVESLESLESNNLDKFSKDIDKIFLDFNKNSHMSYERATILIGKEMANIKESIKVFSRDLVKTFEENKNIIDLFKTISIIKFKLNQINENNKTIEEISNTIISLDKKISEKQEENKNIIKKIEEIKKSEDYLKNLEKKDKIKLFKEELEKYILGLKQFIDFKALANFFHIFEDQMNIVKAHREDFQTAFKKDLGENLIKLLDDANLNSDVISDKISIIKNKKSEIDILEQEVQEDETEKLYSETAKVVLEIGNLRIEKEKQEKRSEKLKLEMKDIKESVEEKLGGSGLRLFETKE